MTLTTSQILAQSSNVGAIKIGLAMGKERFDYWVRKFGFGKTTGVDLPGEERGLVLPVDKYSGSSMGNLPIGQGLAVTPMQMAQAYAAIANGGVLRSPRVVRRVDGKLVAQPKGTRIISRTHRRAPAHDARGRLRARRHGERGVDPRLQARGQDRHREQDRPGHGRVLEVPLHRVVHGLRARAAPAGCSSA